MAMWGTFSKPLMRDEYMSSNTSRHLSASERASGSCGERLRICSATSSEPEKSPIAKRSFINWCERGGCVELDVGVKGGGGGGSSEAKSSSMPGPWWAPGPWNIPG